MGIYSTAKNEIGHKYKNLTVLSRANIWKSNFTLDQLKFMVYAVENEVVKRN